MNDLRTASRLVGIGGLRPATAAALVLLAACCAHAQAPSPPPAQPSEVPEIPLRGRVVCLPEEMHRLHGTDLPSRHEHVYGFRTDDGTCYTLIRTKLSEALFLDERLREKELQLKGRVLPKTQVLDVVSIKSFRDGVLCDLYYYCGVCEIQSVSPAECACCQGPVELVEKPL